MREKAKILAVVGPTASGKTEVALELSKRLPVEVISCDSMQVYRSMPILTQAPSAKHRKALRAHLVSSLSPEKEFNAALFRKKALSLIPAILKRKRTPLFVGGTGLYLRALLDGLFEVKEGGPSKDEALREKLLEEEARQGAGFLHGRLGQVDPESAAKIHPHDLRRTVRALEVFHLTDKSLSLLKKERKGIRDEFSFKIFLLDRDRTELYERIDRRVDKMLETGLEAEVQKLLRKHLSKTAAMALGMREIRDCLDGRRSLEEAVALLKKNTRNYAKRQLSWFRHEKGVEPILVLKNDSASRIARKILERWGKPT